MKVLLFGATGMVGQGVLRECLLDADVESVLCVGRSASGASEPSHPKVRTLVCADLTDLAPVAEQLKGYDVCLFCLGVSAAGMSEADYRRVTYDLTLSVARALIAASPSITFEYVSGESTDSSERTGAMWARVKGATENALLAMPFKASYMIRPGFIRPLHGIRSRTAAYRAIYAIASPLYPLLKALFPDKMTTTERLGRAMLIVAKQGASKRVLETRDLNDVVDRFDAAMAAPTNA
jgi:uncharacterized protein YbjT (DUF2867 family)